MKAGGDAKVTIANAVTGDAFRVATTASAAGLNRWQWDLCSTPSPQFQARVQDFRSGSIGGGFTCPGGGHSAAPGTYRVTVSVGGREIGSQTFQVLEDIWLNER